MNQKIVILSAPSGSGKTTILQRVLKEFPELRFSISATTREKRKGEKEGVDYYYLTPDEFRIKVNNDEFVEYEEVYNGLYYGTLKSEVERIWKEGNHAIFDVDVKGGVSIKKRYKEKAILLFIKPPSVEELEKRLRGRGTEKEQVIRVRLERAKEEMQYEKEFDNCIINDDLERAVIETNTIIHNFIKP
jgi:guanylate kinase